MGGYGNELNDSVATSSTMEPLQVDRADYHASPVRRAHATMHRMAPWLLTGAEALNVALVLGGLALVGDTYAVGFDNRLDGKAVFGTILFLLGIAVGPLALGLAVIGVAQD